MYLFFIIRSDIRLIILTLLHISVAEVNSTVSERDLRSAIHLASAMGMKIPLVFSLHIKKFISFHLSGWLRGLDNSSRYERI